MHVTSTALQISSGAEKKSARELRGPIENENAPLERRLGRFGGLAYVGQRLGQVGAAVLSADERTRRAHHRRMYQTTVQSLRSRSIFNLMIRQGQTSNPPPPFFKG